MREVAAEFERPVLLFSGGKDCVVMAHLAEKAFWPGAAPVPGHARRHRAQLPEVIEFRDKPGRPSSASALVVASVQESIDAGRVRRGDRRRARRATGCRPSRCSTRSSEHGFDAVFGGARRDEEKARAKERVFSFRDEFGQWDPKNQRPELWNLYNGRHRKGEHIRVFPLSNWTELDIWQYIADEEIELPTIYYAHRREVFRRDGMLHGRHRRSSRCSTARSRSRRTVRYRTVGDATCTGAVESTRRHRRRRDRRGRGHAASPSAAPPAPTTSSPKPAMEDRKQRGLLLMELLRFATAGSVDDGKSTLIGRLLYDSKADLRGPARGASSAPAASAATSTPTSRCSPTACGPSASRASRSTSPTATSRRPSASSSSPTRRATCSTRATWSPGASTADLALILVDARNGVVEQSRRHAFIASLLGVPHLVLCVNKMDLVDYDAGGLRGASRTSSASSRTKLDVARPHVHPGLGAARRQRRRPLRQHALVRGADACCTTSKRCTSRPTATSSTAGSRCST